MTETNKKSTRKKRNKGGRPSDYRAAHCSQTEKLLALGATKEQVADFFEVSVTTLFRWSEKHPEFRNALRVGKIRADAEVADSLYRRACGYRHKAVKIFADPKSGKTVAVPYTEIYPPDTGACIKWLTNRQPKLWRDKVVVEHENGSLAERLKRARERMEKGKASSGRNTAGTEGPISGREA